MIGDVWDQIIRNEECYTRLLKVDELYRLNQRVNELIEERHPRPIGLSSLIEPRAMAMLLRLLYDRVIFRQTSKSGRVLELQLTAEQMETFLKQAALPKGDIKKELIGEIRKKAAEDAEREAERKFRPELEKLRRENGRLDRLAKQTGERLRLENDRLQRQLNEAHLDLKRENGKLRLENEKLKQQVKDEREKLALGNDGLKQQLNEAQTDLKIENGTLKSENENLKRLVRDGNEKLKQENENLKRLVRDGNEKLKQENEKLKFQAKQAGERAGQENKRLQQQVTDMEEMLRSKDGTHKVLLERLAGVIGLTYAELGDGAPLTDDEALDRIREMLLYYDAQIVTRNYKRGYDEIIMKKAWERMSHA